RRLEPRDPDFMVAHARVLSWAGRTPQALALFDSVLARAPDRADALAGRARVVAWSGDLDRAERLWRAALALHPDDAELLFGLAQTLYWHDQPALAEAYLTRARRVAPGDNEARDLARTLRALLRPDVRTSVDGAAIPTTTTSWRKMPRSRARSAQACGGPSGRGGGAPPIRWARGRGTAGAASGPPRWAGA